MKKLILIAIFASLVTVSVVGAEKMSDDIIKIKINNNTFDVKLENNSATLELVDMLKKENVTVETADYGGFEKVGSLGFSLPTSDENIETAPGDVVLYQGNQLSLFYSSHSWSYTKLGKIQNVDANGLKDVLGSGDVNITLTLLCKNSLASLSRR